MSVMTEVFIARASSDWAQPGVDDEDRSISSREVSNCRRRATTPCTPEVASICTDSLKKMKVQEKEGNGWLWGVSRGGGEGKELCEENAWPWIRIRFTPRNKLTR